MLPMVLADLLTESHMARKVVGRETTLPLPGTASSSTQQLGALAHVVKLRTRENDQIEAVDTQGVVLTRIMSPLTRRSVRVLSVVFDGNMLGSPKPVAHHTV